MPITLDGILTDWTTADRLELPGSGVPDYALYGRYEAGNFVFALSAPVAISGNTTFWLNTDRDLSTGYKVWGFAAGAEYNINFDAAGIPRLYTGADGQTLVSTAVVDYVFNAGRTAVEFSISAADLGATQALNVYVDVNNQVFLPVSYANYAYSVAAPTSALPPVVVGNSTLDGSLSEWTAADRIDSSLGVAGYEVYGRVTADNYVIALRSVTPIGANTTAWLNTDRNAATGFQIFGFAGGSEYNINFDALGNAVLYTGNAGQTAVVGGDIVERFSTDRTIVEFAIPKELLGFTGVAGAINTLYDINDSVFLSTSYSTIQYAITPSTAVVVGTVTLDGALGDWTAANRIDGIAPVAGYEVYGRTSGDSFVFAVHAPAGISIGANTTIWLNTDQNVATGFDIFPGPSFEGGAEFNINFDSGGVPHLYSGAAGETLVAGSEVQFARSADGTTVEFSVTRTAIGNPSRVDTLIDVNNSTFLPGSYSGPAYAVLDNTGLPARTDFSHRVAIVYSETTAARYFGNPDVNVNETAYAQLFMAAQNQAAMAGVSYDLLSEADLTNLANLVNYDAIIFPAFQYVNTANVAAISNNLTLLAQNYNTSFIAAGNFMTADQNGNLLAGDPYANMRVLFDVQPQASGFAGTTSVTINSAGTGFAGVGGYSANETIHTYSNAAGVGWLAFSDATPGTTPLTVIDNQTVTGTGQGTYAAVVASSVNGDRNVHFSTEALLGDNNQLWQAITYAVNGATGPSVGLQMGRQSSIVASRNDMDQSRNSDEVDPAGATPGIYDRLLPILAQWKADFNFVGSYYINVGDNPGQAEETIWSVSLPYYQQLIAMGNEIGSHSLTHLEAVAPTANNTNFLTTGTGPGTFDYEFRYSRDIIQANIAAVVPGYQIAGAAVPGAPEYNATSEQIIQYYEYLSGGYASVGAGYPGAFGYLSPAYDDTGRVYLAPNMSFDFTLIGFQGRTPAQALDAWQAEFAALTSHSDVPVVIWPWHDYGPTNWENGGYTQAMFTEFIRTAANSGAEFVTLEDLADRIRSFERSSVTSSVSGNVITATVTSTDAGNFALDVDNLGSQVIASVAGWYAYDNDSVFTDRDGGTFAITLGAAAADVTHVTDLGDRNELVSITGDGTNLNFTLVGEGRVVVDLKNPAGTTVGVTGATIVSLVGDILTIDVGAIGTHAVAITQTTTTGNTAPVITSNGGGATAAVSVAENGLAVTTLTATDANAGQTLTYAIEGGADAGLFNINATTGALAFRIAPDFEAPQDATLDNVYNVIVRASDNGLPSAADTQALAITVTNVNGTTYNGTTAADNRSGTAEADTMNGAGGNDILSGLAGNDTLNGGAGNDTLNGDAGNDRLTGAAGFDILTGGSGADTFVFATTAQIGTNAAVLNLERITDFQLGIDKLDFAAIDADTAVAADQAFTLLAANAPLSGPGQLRWYYDTASALTIIEGNVNATLTPEFRLAVAGQLAFTTGDFIL